MDGVLREKFEEWCNYSGWNLSRDSEGNYMVPTTDAAWGGFVAALNIFGVLGQPCDDDTEYLK